MTWSKKIIQNLKKPQWTFFLIVFLLIVGIITIQFSYALFTATVEKSGTLNIVAGDFSYALSANELTNNRMTVNPNEEKTFEITITNTNDRDTSYELYYKLISPSALPTNVEIGYANSTQDPVKGNEIKKDAIKVVQIAVRNHSTENITLEFGVQGGFIGKDLVLEKGTTLNHEIEVVYDPSGAPVPELEENMIPVKYDATSKNWIKADSSNPLGNPWYSYHKKEWANAVTVDQSKALDLSGNNNNGTIHGVTVTSGQASFDGVDDYIECGLANYNFGSQQTMMIRLKIHSLNAGRYTTFFSNFEGSGSGFIYDRTTNQLMLEVHNGTKYLIASVPYNLNFNQLYTLVGTYDGENVKLYIDGKLVASTPGTGNISGNYLPYLIGGNPQEGYISEHAEITTTEAMIFDRTLSEQEVKEYSQNGTKGMNKEGLLLHYDFKKGNDIEIGNPISMDAINTMMVWVPRYKYTMPAAKEGQIDIIFENNTTAKSTGTATGTSYLTHPAFTFGKTELNGLWVGKFESSPDVSCTTSTGAQGTGCDLTSIKPLIKPNMKSWTGARVSTFFTASRNVQAAGNPYGYNQSGVDTHMMKNSEWGAVAYLTQSKYGRCTDGVCTEVTMNNLNSGDGRTITGCAADTISAAELKQSDCPETNRYNTDKGVLASTTGNVYGVYDMAGGDWEYVMGNYNKYSGYTAISYTVEQAKTILNRTDNKEVGIWNSGFNGPVYGKALDNTTTLTWTTGVDFPEEKYYDLYTTNSVATSCNGKVCLGHALSETAGWYEDYQYHVSSWSPWFGQSGSWGTGSNTGVFSSFCTTGSSNPVYSSRLVVSKD